MWHAYMAVLAVIDIPPSQQIENFLGFDNFADRQNSEFFTCCHAPGNGLNLKEYLRLL